VEDIAADIGTQADWLMACMAFESGFRAGVLNKAGSGATGLIQFMPNTARALGTTIAALAVMTAEEQLRYVHDYFKPYRGRLNCLEDVYMAILWPAAIGKSLDYVLFDRQTKPITYRQNTGLDFDADGRVTKYEACSKVRQALKTGLMPQNSK
jgi:hypothetical protein